MKRHSYIPKVPNTFSLNSSLELNNDKTKRYSFISDVSPIGEIKYNNNKSTYTIEQTFNKNNTNKRVRKISESYANDIKRRENILKRCSLSPPVFKFIGNIYIYIYFLTLILFFFFLICK